MIESQQRMSVRGLVEIATGRRWRDAGGEPVASAPPAPPFRSLHRSGGGHRVSFPSSHLLCATKLVESPGSQVGMDIRQLLQRYQTYTQRLNLRSLHLACLVRANGLAHETRGLALRGRQAQQLGNGTR